MRAHHDFVIAGFSMTEKRLSICFKEKLNIGSSLKRPASFGLNVNEQIARYLNKQYYSSFYKQ